MTTRTRRWLAIALGVVAALAVLVACFDGNWVRPAIERHLTEAAGRPVRFDDLRIGLDRHLDLDVRLRGVNIANAPWADTRQPMASVAEARFDVSLRSLLRHEPLVHRLVLVGGRIDLERQADGLRNWRITHPEDRGPGHVVIQAIEAHETSLRFVHRGVDLDITATAAPNEEAERPTRIAFAGSFHGERFEGQVATGPELTLQGTGRWFPLRGEMNAAGSQLRAEGRAADFVRRARLDGHVRVEGPSLSRLRGFLRAPLPESKPFSLDADLKKDATDSTFANITARIGRTPVTGELAYDIRKQRNWLSATLRSEVAQWDDLESLTRSGGEPKLASTRSEAGPRPLHLARLDRVDARLDVAIGRLVLPRLPALGGVRFKAALDDGRLEVGDLDIGLARGHASGSLSLDARAEPPAARLQVAWHGIEIADLLHMAEAKRVTGVVDGRIDLKAEGDSLVALAASTRGQASANLRQGSLAKRLDAELGLDGARLVGSWFGGDEAIPLRCASASFDVQRGIAEARGLSIDTANTQIAGVGRIDLRAASLALMLTPRARHPGLLTLERSIAVSGPLAKPRVRVVDRVEPVGEAAACGPA